MAKIYQYKCNSGVTGERRGASVGALVAAGHDGRDGEVRGAALRLGHHPGPGPALRAHIHQTRQTSVQDHADTHFTTRIVSNCP